MQFETLPDIKSKNSSAIKSRWIGRFILFVCFVLIQTYASGQCIAHTISSSEGNDIIFACAGDGKPDNVIFTKSDTSTQLKYAFIQADNSDNIIRIQSSPVFNFDGSTPAAYRIWGLSYSDSITFKTGSDVTTVNAVRGCALLSDNFIRVIRDKPLGRNAVLQSGRSDTTICSANNRIDTIRLVLPPVSNGKLVFIVCKFDGTIVDIFNKSEYVIDQNPPGVYLIYSVSYTGVLSISPNASNINTSVISNGCYSVGPKPLRINLEPLQSGRLQAQNVLLNYCPNNPYPDTVYLRLDNSNAPKVAYVMLDDLNRVKQISFSSGIQVNNYAEGVYNIKALAFSGDLLLKVGDTIKPNAMQVFSNDCYAWADGFVSIRIITPKGGSLITNNGDSIAYGCPGDRLPDRFTFYANNQATTDYKVIVVNNKGIIKDIGLIGNGIDFEGYAVGDYKAYGVSYTGVWRADRDSSINSQLSSECFALSTNFIPIYLEVAKAGTVSLKDGSNVYYVCSDNTGYRKIELDRKNASKSMYEYIVTSPSGIILGFPKKDSLNFNNTIPGQELRIYGISYTGSRIINMNSNIFVSSYSDGCYSISSNFIRVVIDRPRGGGVRLANGLNKELICPGDSSSKTLSFRNVSSSSNLYQFVITDSASRILDITSNFAYPFDSMPKGTYFIYGVSYIGNVLVKKADTLFKKAYASDCFSYSENKIEVVLNNIDAGRLTTSEGSDRVFTCPSNLDPDEITMIPVGANALGYQYAITNELNMIIGYSQLDKIDFGSATINSVCRVYGIAYKGAFNSVLNRSISEVAFSSQCFDITDNYVTIKKIVPGPHRISSNLKDSIMTICVGDSQVDTIKLRISDTTGIKRVFLGVESGKIISIYTDSILNVEKDSAGLLRIYSLTYTGKLLAGKGLDLVSGLALSDDCFALSSNFILIDKVKTGPFCLIVGNPDQEISNKLKVYPNPDSKGEFTLHLDRSGLEGKYNKTEVSISDLHGKIVYKKHWNVTEDLIVHSHDFTSGIYFIQLFSDNFHITRKIVIQR